MSDSMASGFDSFQVHMRSRDVAHVLVSGELDIQTAPQLESALEQLLSDGHLRRLVLDLREVDFLGCSGVGIVALLKTLSERGGVDIAIVRGNPRVQRVFAIAGLDG